MDLVPERFRLLLVPQAAQEVAMYFGSAFLHHLKFEKQVTPPSMSLPPEPAADDVEPFWEVHQRGRTSGKDSASSGWLPCCLLMS